MFPQSSHTIPAAPPVQLTVNPLVLSMTAAFAELLHASVGLGIVTVAVNAPTPCPPFPMNVNVPPVVPIAPTASGATYVPVAEFGQARPSRWVR